MLDSDGATTVFKEVVVSTTGIAVQAFGGGISAEHSRLFSRRNSGLTLPLNHTAMYGVVGVTTRYFIVGTTVRQRRIKQADTIVSEGQHGRSRGQKILYQTHSDVSEVLKNPRKMRLSNNLHWLLL